MTVKAITQAIDTVGYENLTGEAVHNALIELSPFELAESQHDVLLVLGVHELPELPGHGRRRKLDGLEGPARGPGAQDEEVVAG